MKAILAHPQQSGTGPAGARFEHWASLEHHPVGLEAAGSCSRACWLNVSM